MKAVVVVDTSALVAHILGEPTGDRVLDALERAPTVALSAASLVECSIVLVRRLGPPGNALVDELVERVGVDVVPVTRAIAERARAAFVEYGKGRHPAALNFGDCFSYALAKERGEPLLFVGDDFSRTDVDPAPY